MATRAVRPGASGNHEPVAESQVIRLPVPSVMWQSKFYLRHVHGRRPGWRLNILGMSDELAGMDPDVRLPEEAIRSWLGALEEHGYVARVKSRYRYDKWPGYEVCAPPHRDAVAVSDGT